MSRSLKKFCSLQIMLAAMFLCLPFQATASPLLGISEQRDQSFSSPLFQRLNIENVRITVPWDAMKPGFAHNEIELALSNVRGQGIEPLVVIGKSRYVKKMPTTKVYQKMVTALISRHPWIRYWSPFNEPNLSHGAKFQPENIAAYSKSIHKACLKYKCRVTSPAVLDQPNLLRWSKEYIAALPVSMRPKIWLLHNYNDANHFSYSRTAGFLKLFRKNPIWLGETGGLINGSMGSSAKWPKGVAHQNKVFKWLMSSYSKRFPAVKRVYVYQWQGSSANNDWDSGIVDLNGNPRPIYHSIERYLKSNR
jgi:hypothetical protein